MTRLRLVLLGVLGWVLLAGCGPKRPSEPPPPVEEPEVRPREWAEDTLRVGQRVTVDGLEIDASALPHPTDGAFNYVHFKLTNVGSSPIDVRMVGLEIEIRQRDSYESGPGVLVERQPTSIRFGVSGLRDGCYLAHDGSWPVAVTVPPPVNTPRDWGWEMVVGVADLPVPGPDEVMVRRGIFEVGGRRVEVEGGLRTPNSSDHIYNDYVRGMLPFDCNGPFAGDRGWEWPHLAGVPVERLEAPSGDGPRAWTGRTLQLGHFVTLDGLTIGASAGAAYPADDAFTYVEFTFANEGASPVDVTMLGLEIEVRNTESAQFGPGQTVPRLPNDIFFLPNAKFHGDLYAPPVTAEEWCDLKHRGSWPVTFTVPPTGRISWEMFVAIDGVPVPGPDELTVRRGIFEVNSQRVEVAAVMRPADEDSEPPAYLAEMNPFDCNGPIPQEICREATGLHGDPITVCGEIFPWERPHRVDAPETVEPPTPKRRRR